MNYGELVHTENVQGVTYNLYVAQEDIDVRGNASAWDDEAENEAYANEIIERLDNGEVWAWAAVTVEAEFMGVSACDHLGACCYKDTADFVVAGGYYDDMKSEALDALVAKCKATAAVYRKLRKLVKA